MSPPTSSKFDPKWPRPYRQSHLASAISPPKGSNLAAFRGCIGGVFLGFSAKLADPKVPFERKWDMGHGASDGGALVSHFLKNGCGATRDSGEFDATSNSAAPQALLSGIGVIVSLPPIIRLPAG